MTYGKLNGHMSCDRWRHVTLEGQGRDPNMFGASYLEKAGDTDWYYGVPIGNGIWVSNSHVPNEPTARGRPTGSLAEITPY